MTIDPRLAHTPLLVLAAMWASQRRQASDWRQTEGLAALLAAARRPERSPWQLPISKAVAAWHVCSRKLRQWQEERHGT